MSIEKEIDPNCDICTRACDERDNVIGKCSLFSRVSAKSRPVTVFIVRYQDGQMSFREYKAIAHKREWRVDMGGNIKRIRYSGAVSSKLNRSVSEQYADALRGLAKLMRDKTKVLSDQVCQLEMVAIQARNIAEKYELPLDK